MLSKIHTKYLQRTRVPWIDRRATDSHRRSLLVMIEDDDDDDHDDGGCYDDKMIQFRFHSLQDCLLYRTLY